MNDQASSTGRKLSGRGSQACVESFYLAFACPDLAAAESGRFSIFAPQVTFRTVLCIFFPPLSITRLPFPWAGCWRLEAISSGRAVWWYILIKKGHDTDFFALPFRCVLGPKALGLRGHTNTRTHPVAVAQSWDNAELPKVPHRMVTRRKIDPTCARWWQKDWMERFFFFVIQDWSAILWKIVKERSKREIVASLLKRLNMMLGWFTQSKKRMKLSASYAKEILSIRVEK